MCPTFFRLSTGATLWHTFRAAGFTRIRLERYSSVLRYYSAEEACRAAFEESVVALACQRFDERVRDEVQAKYLASIEPYRSGSAYEVPGEFVIASARKPGA